MMIQSCMEYITTKREFYCLHGWKELYAEEKVRAMLHRKLKNGSNE